jgi:hypothetical protein
MSTLQLASIMGAIPVSQHQRAGHAWRSQTHEPLTGGDPTKSGPWASQPQNQQPRPQREGTGVW